MGPKEARCKQVRGLIEAYALGATNADETAFVERYLPDCPEAMAALADYYDITEALLYLPATKPERSHTTEPKRPAAKQPAPEAKMRVLPPAPRQKPEQTQAPARSNAWWRAAGAVAAVTLILLNGYLLWDNNSLRDAETETIARIEALEAQLEQATIRNLPVGNAMHRVVDVEVPQHGHVHSVLAWDADTQAGTFYVNGLASSAPERLYQLWLVRDSEDPVLLGTVEVDEAEAGVLLFRTAEPLEDYSTFLLTTGADGAQVPGETLFSGEL